MNVSFRIRLPGLALEILDYPNKFIKFSQNKLENCWNIVLLKWIQLLISNYFCPHFREKLCLKYLTWFLTRPYLESKNLIRPYLESKNLIRPYLESKNLIRPNLESKNLRKIYSNNHRSYSFVARIKRLGEDEYTWNLPELTQNYKVITGKQWYQNFTITGQIFIKNANLYHLSSKGNFFIFWSRFLKVW